MSTAGTARPVRERVEATAAPRPARWFTVLLITTAVLLTGCAAEDQREAIRA